MIDLPVDSSVIDFAYAVHSDVGNHLSSAKVNGKFVSIDTKLKNGDIVNIETKPSSHPTVKWLKNTKTSVAQRHIRNETAKKTRWRNSLWSKGLRRQSLFHLPTYHL